MFSNFNPPFWLKNGYLMTLYTVWVASKHWETTISCPRPPYQSHIFEGAIPLWGIMACPRQPKGTIIGTYGITGNLANQWFLSLLGRKAYGRGYAVILFDWRGHGKTAELSPVLTSDGIYEGQDFLEIAAIAKRLGYPAPFWFTGYSLGGQLALWGGREVINLRDKPDYKGLKWEDIGGCTVICPNLDANRSLTRLMHHPLGRYVEQSIAKELKKLAWQLQKYHPNQFDSAAIERAESIMGFDRELVIPCLGFATVNDYYTASSPLLFLSKLNKPTLILYASDDPLFDPSIIPDLKSACQKNPKITLGLTQHGGHVGYISKQGETDSDRWWAWNRVLDFISMMN